MSAARNSKNESKANMFYETRYRDKQNVEVVVGEGAEELRSWGVEGRAA